MVMDKDITKELKNIELNFMACRVRFKRLSERDDDEKIKTLRSISLFLRAIVDERISIKDQISDEENSEIIAKVKDFAKQYNDALSQLKGKYDERKIRPIVIVDSISPEFDNYIKKMHEFLEESQTNEDKLKNSDYYDNVIFNYIYSHMISDARLIKIDDKWEKYPTPSSNMVTSMGIADKTSYYLNIARNIKDVENANNINTERETVTLPYYNNTRPISCKNISMQLIAETKVENDANGLSKIKLYNGRKFGEGDYFIFTYDNDEADIHLYNCQNVSKEFVKRGLITNGMSVKDKAIDNFYKQIVKSLNIDEDNLSILKSQEQFIKEEVNYLVSRMPTNEYAVFMQDLDGHMKQLGNRIAELTEYVQQHSQLDDVSIEDDNVKEDFER